MPRLTKGEIAPGIQLRRDRSMSSASARISMLRSLLNSNCPIPEQMLSIKNFRQLAMWEDRRRGITPLSIKTLRKHLDSLYEGGSHRFREDMAQLLERQFTPKIEMVQNEEMKRRRVDRLSTDAAMEMTARYLDLLERFKKLSLASEVAERELISHMRRYREGGVTLRAVKNDA